MDKSISDNIKISECRKQNTEYVVALYIFNWVICSIGCSWWTFGYSMSFKTFEMMDNMTFC